MSSPSIKFDLQIKFGSEYGPEEERAVLDVLRKGAPTSGEACIQFEKDFAAYCGTQHARVVSNGTAALFLSMVALDVKPGDRVVVTGVGIIGLGAVAIAAIEGAEVWAMGTQRDLSERLPIATQVGAARTLVFGDEALVAITEWTPRVWIEASGAAAAVEAASNAVAKGGTIVSPGLGSGPWNVNVVA